MEDFQSRREKNACSKQNGDRKKRHIEEMKVYWRKIEEQGIEKLAYGPQMTVDKRC